MSSKQVTVIITTSAWLMEHQQIFVKKFLLIALKSPSIKTTKPLVMALMKSKVIKVVVFLMTFIMQTPMNLSEPFKAVASNFLQQ